LFVRSYERGERVYLAMASRGYAGTLPVTTHQTDETAWGVALLLPALAACVALAAWLGR
jgi:cobalt/nickel transport system permease protein